MTALENVEWEAPLVAPTRDPELERNARRVFGLVPPMAPYVYASPWIARSMGALELTGRALVHTDAELRLLIELVVSQDNSCRYCYAVSRTLLTVFGVPEKKIVQLEHDLLAADLSPAVRAALDFARRLSRANPLPMQADLDRLAAAGLSPEAIREIIFMVGVTIFYNRMATLLAVPIATVERVGRSRALARLMAVVSRLLVRTPRLDPPPPPLADTPYDYLIAAFGDSPAAQTLERIMREAWTSPVLSRRAKAYVFAVVARGLGCRQSEREATRLLGAEGVEPHTVETTLAHLASAELDRVEAAIIPFARETIWYRPAPVQRRARGLRDHLTEAQFLEAVGSMSLANALCRMNVVLACR